MAYDAELAERVRDRMVAVAGVSEKKMFGGLAFLTWGNMTVGVYGDGLLARIYPGTAGQGLAAEPGARPFDMGGRERRGGVGVAAESLTYDELDRWIGLCRGYLAPLPRK